jgi:hypothetical protein
VLIFAVSTFIHWQRKGFSDVKDALVIGAEGAIATVIVFIFVLALHFFFWTPKRMNESLIAQLHPKQEEPRIRLDVADEQSRRQINDLEAKLETANKTIVELRSSIASAKRSLLPEQRSRLIAALKQYGSFEVGVRDAGTQESQDYADQLKTALVEGGWKLREPQFLIVTHQAAGLWVMVRNGNSPPKGANELLSALEAARLDAKGIEVPSIREGTFDLNVGFPVNDPTVQPIPPSPAPNTEASPR